MVICSSFVFVWSSHTIEIFLIFFFKKKNCIKSALNDATYEWLERFFSWTKTILKKMTSLFSKLCPSVPLSLSISHSPSSEISFCIFSVVKFIILLKCLQFVVGRDRFASNSWALQAQISLEYFLYARLKKKFNKFFIWFLYIHLTNFGAHFKFNNSQNYERKNHFSFFLFEWKYYPMLELMWKAFTTVALNVRFELANAMDTLRRDTEC